MKPTDAEMVELLRDLNPHHTTFQLDRLITVRNSSGQLYGAYRQALRELAARRDALDEATEAIELLEIDARDHERQAQEDLTGPEGERHAVLARQARRRAVRQRERLAHVERELVRFAQQVRELKGRLGPLTAEQLDELDRQYWGETFRQRAAMELRFTGTLALPTVEGLLALPDDMRRELLHDLPSLAKCFDSAAMAPGLSLLERHHGA